MATNLSYNEIEQLVAEKKALPGDYQDRVRLKLKSGHKEAQIDLMGSNGSEFRIIYRQADEDPLAFSIILAYLPSETNECFRLRRYNGKSHEHTNKLDNPRDRFFDSHIHIATQRYQDAGFREDAYAEPTDRFSTLQDAFNCMVEDCSLVWPKNHQIPLL